MVFFYARDSEKYKYSSEQGWIQRKNKRSERTRVFNASCELGDIAGIIEEFNGALSFEDIVDKLTIPQITIMRLDKPSVDLDEDEKNNKGSINSAEEFLSFINKQKT